MTHPFSNQEIQDKLISLLGEALEIDPAGIDPAQELTSYGLDSMQAVNIAVELVEWLNMELPATLLWEFPTIQALATHLASMGDEENSATAQEDSVQWPSIRVIQSQGLLTPFFCVPGLGGSVFHLHPLSKHLGTNQPFFAFQAPLLEDFHDWRSHYNRIPEVAEKYTRELRQFRPEGPYLLGGYSHGGLVALEIARRLRAEGQEVPLVALFDTKCVGYVPMHEEKYPLLWRLKLRLTDLIRRPPRDWIPVFISSIDFAMKRRLRAYNSSRRAKREYRQLHPDLKLQEARRGSYRTESYDGQVVLFRALNREGFTKDPNLGWDHVLSQGVITEDTPGDHKTFIQEPNVVQLAAKLRTRLTHPNCGKP